MATFHWITRLSRSFAVATAVAALFAFSARSQSAPPPSYQFASGKSSLGIPIEVVADGLVLVKGTINGHPGWFVVDNGTQGFVVDRNYAQQISLQATGSAVTREVGSDANHVGIIRDVQIGLPGFELTHRNLVVLDLKSLEPAIGHEVDGIIGSRLFDDFVVEIDYAGRRLSICLPGQYHVSGNETVIPVRIDQHGFQYLDATVALPGISPVTGSFLIDGGANYYAALYKPFSDAHRIPPTTMRLLGEPGTDQPREGRADRIDIGSYSVRNAAISFVQDVEGLMAAKDYAGLIGAELLERFTVVFDNAEKHILLTPNRDYATPAGYDESGVRLRAEGPDFHRFVVTRVAPQSPAADVGIQPGDVIESIDQRSTSNLTLTEMRRMLRRPGATCRAGIRRGSQEIEVTIRLRPLI